MLLISIPPTAVHTARAQVQPLLLELAQSQPERTIDVIVQKFHQDISIEQEVTHLGGIVKRDLHIINAFSAKLPAQTAVALAQVPGVRWISLDGPVVRPSGLLRADNVPQMTHQLMLPLIMTGGGAANIEDEAVTTRGGGNGNGGGGGGGGGNDGDSSCPDCPSNYYLETLNVHPTWEMGLRGEDISVAVVDSGIAFGKDFKDVDDKCKNNQGSRLLDEVAFNSNLHLFDNSGHGTHVAGIIGGNGCTLNGLYGGIAPKVNLLSLNISDSTGMAYESDTVAAMQWILDNKDTYNIRVVNLSINAATASSYHTSPLDAAAEILWFNGIVVVASAGNSGTAGAYNTINAAPANDPFIITVGASHEQGTASLEDDTVAAFSALGTTDDGHSKPEIIAPGKDIISVLAQNSAWRYEHPERTVGNDKYFRMSGTSMAAPMVSGAIALLLQDEPDLTPDQVKYRLMNASNTIHASNNGVDYAYLDVYAAVTGTTTASANTGIAVSSLLTTGPDGVLEPTVNWGSVSWNSVSWNSVNWGSVNWGSVNWGSVNWGSVNWDD